MNSTKLLKLVVDNARNEGLIVKLRFFSVEQKFALKYKAWQCNESKVLSVGTWQEQIVMVLQATNKMIKLRSEA